MKVIWSLFWVNLVAILLMMAQGQQDEWLITNGASLQAAKVSPIL
jgi:hypothetical protein